MRSLLFAVLMTAAVYVLTSGGNILVAVGLALFALSAMPSRVRI